MNTRYKGGREPPSLILRLLGSKDYGWEAKRSEPPPAIQIEAANELRRLQTEVDVLYAFLVSKNMLPEFVTWSRKTPE